MHLRRMLFILLIVGAAVLVACSKQPPPYQTVVAYQGGWQVIVTYQPGGKDALISLRMDGLSRYVTVEYEVLSSLDWAPTWKARMEGKLSEYLTLNNGHSTVPGGMSENAAKVVARSYRVNLNLDGTSRTIDFSDARFA